MIFIFIINTHTYINLINNLKNKIIYILLEKIKMQEIIVSRIIEYLIIFRILVEIKIK